MYPRLVLLWLFVGLASSQSVSWSGYTWYLRDDSGSSPSSPGPNYWQSSQNVVVDSSNNLHLSIKNRSGVWSCSELYTADSVRFGFGTFQWKLSSPVNAFDPSIVFGMFPYTLPSIGPDETNEIDIEFSQWGNSANPNRLSWTVYPAVPGVTSTEVDVPVTISGGSTARFTWNTTTIHYQFFSGLVDITDNPSSSLLQEWYFQPANYSQAIPQQPLPMHMNLWLFESVAPASGQNVTVTLVAFDYINATTVQNTVTTSPAPSKNTSPPSSSSATAALSNSSILTLMSVVLLSVLLAH